MTIDKLENRIICEDVERIISEDLPWENLRGSTALITGASGMIPSYVLYTLLGLNDSMDMGIKVIALVRNEDSAAPTATIRANLVGTFNLLDLAVNSHAKAFVLMSSSEVYGQVPAGTKSISETDYGYLDCLNPRSCYSEGKRAAETICASFMAQYGIDCKTPRFAHIYGPGLGLNDGRVQADFAANVFRGEDIVMNSDGSSMRSYTYVGDAVSGIFYILLKGSETAYNVADSDNTISIRQLAEAFLASRPEKNLKLVMNIDQSKKASYNPAAFIGLDNSKLKALGWAPKVSVAEGTARMISNYEITEKA